MAASGLAKKLGVRTGETVVVLGAPARVSAAIERHADRVFRQLRPAPIDSVVIFVDRLLELEDRLVAILGRLHPDGQLWVAWRSRRAGDVSEDIVRRIGLTAGMVDRGVVALDRVWSGMRLVNRPENRAALSYRLDAPRRAKRSSRASEPAFASGPGSALAIARARKRT